jgi:hypothetical protein
MITLIQFLSIVLVLTLALPGTTILWSVPKSTRAKLKIINLVLAEKKAQLSASFLPELKRIAAMFF